MGQYTQEAASEKAKLDTLEKQSFGISKLASGTEFADRLTLQVFEESHRFSLSDFQSFSNRTSPPSQRKNRLRVT